MYWTNLVLICLFLSTQARSFKLPIRIRNDLVGGRNPMRGEVKYIVVVDDGHSICGGGIIGEKYILTASHCIEVDKRTGRLLYPMRIIGGTNVAFDFDKSRVIIRDVARAFLPGPFMQEIGFNDIAVLELTHPLGLLKNHDKLQKLKLPEPLQYRPIVYPTYDNEHVTFAGYGDTEAYRVRNHGQYETISDGAGPLKVADALINGADECDKVAKNRKDLICLSIVEDKTKRQKQGTCHGDSGGPAVYNNSIVIGVTSRGVDCDNNLVPSLFTRVSYFIPFIEKIMSGRRDGLLIYEN